MFVSLAFGFEILVEENLTIYFILCSKKYVELHEKRLEVDDDGSEDLISEYLREMKRREHEEDPPVWRGSAFSLLTQCL